MMTLIRFVLGKIILTLNAVFKPKGLTRDAIEQIKVDEETKDWQLYQLEACPFCVKVRREMARLSLHIPLREIGKDPKAHQELMAGGKKDQAPCLRIPATTHLPERWLYESSDIVSFLQSKFRVAESSVNLSNKLSNS
jgi:glutaredoxin